MPCVLSECSYGQEEALVAIQQLQLFFLASLERGELVVSSQVTFMEQQEQQQHHSTLETLEHGVKGAQAGLDPVIKEKNEVNLTRVSKQATIAAAEPEAQHAGWLRNQYSIYISQLQQLLRSSAHSPVQVLQ